MAQETRAHNWLYLLAGEDEFRKNLAFSKLRAKLIGEAIDAFNYDVYYGRESSAAQLIRSLETLPLTGTKKLVVLREPQDLPQQEQAIMLDYFKSSQPRRSVLILISSSSPTKEKGFIGAVSRYAKRFNFDRLQTAEITSWIINEFKLRNKIISQRAAQLISETAESDLGRIYSIIEQLSIFTDRNERIADGDVMQFTEGAVVESSTFKLLDAINDKDTNRSIRILENLLRLENNPSQILGLLGWHITRLIMVKRLLINKMPRDQMLSYLGVGNYLLNKLISQAEDLSLSQLKRHLESLVDTDLMLKTSGVKGEFGLEALVVRLSS